MWHRWKVQTEDLAHEQVSCAKSRYIFIFCIKSHSFHTIALNVHFSIRIVYFLHFKHIFSKNINITTKSKGMNMRPLATQHSDEYSLYSSF